jgi:hypothetical protein
MKKKSYYLHRLTVIEKNGDGRWDESRRFRASNDAAARKARGVLHRRAVRKHGGIKILSESLWRGQGSGRPLRGVDFQVDVRQRSDRIG